MTLLEAIHGCYSYAVVIKGEIQAVELKLNTAYSFEESKMQIHATNPATLHPYEDVDIGPSTN